MSTIQHSALTTVHKFAYVSSVDPGRVGPYKGWVDTSTTPYTLRVRSSDNTTWSKVGIWTQNLIDIGNITPSNDDVLQFTNVGTWGNTSLANLKTQLALNNVPNVDARARSTHTGTQTSATISDFTSAVDARILNRIKTSYLVSQVDVVSDTIVDNTSLSVNLESGAQYSYRVEVYHQTAGGVAGGGIKFELHSYATVASSYGSVETRDNTGLVASNQNRPVNTVFTASPVGASITTFRGSMQTGSTGAVTLKVAQNTPNAAVLSIRPGSSMIFTRLA